MKEKIQNTKLVFKQMALLRDAILKVGIGKKKSQDLTLQQCEDLCACWAELSCKDILYSGDAIFAVRCDQRGRPVFASPASPQHLEELFDDAQTVVAILQKTPAKTLSLASEHLLASYGAFFAALFHKGFTLAESRLPRLFLKLLYGNDAEAGVGEKQIDAQAMDFTFESKGALVGAERENAMKVEYPMATVEAFLCKVWQWGSKEADNKTTETQKGDAKNSQCNGDSGGDGGGDGEGLLSEDGVLSMAIAIAAKKTTLSFGQAKQLGDFLFSQDRGKPQKNNFSRARDDFFCGFFASYLRVRYESQAEWRGLLSSLETRVSRFPFSNLLAGNQLSPGEPNRLVKNTTDGQISAIKREEVAIDETLAGNKLKQAGELETNGNGLVFLFAEPVNGFSKTFFLSPLYGAWLQSKGFRACHLVGENPGPKMVMNLFDLFSFMQLPSMEKSNGINIQATQTVFGSIADYQNFCLPISWWRARRLAIAKRPFLSTLEKFVSPFAKTKTILVTSAFHPPYWEKMVKLGQFAGYAGVLVLKSSREGGLTPSLVRPLRASLSLRSDVFSLDDTSAGGTVGQLPEYWEEKLEIPVVGKSMVSDEKVELTCQANATLLKQSLASPHLTLPDEKYEQRFKTFAQLLEIVLKRIVGFQ